MRVLALLHDAFGGVGGIAKFNSDLLTAVASYPACDEIVALPTHTAQPTEGLPPKLRYGTNGVRGKLGYVAALLRLLARGQRFDLILCAHVNLLPSSEIGRLRTGAPILLMIYGIDAWRPTRRRFVNYVARRIDYFAGISRLTNERFVNWAGMGADSGFLLPCSVDLERYRPGPRNADLLLRYGLEGRTVLMTLARLDTRERCKGTDEVLGVLPDLVADIPNLVYLIAGEGTDRPRLEARARALGCESYTVFTGYVAEQEKVDLYRLADAFVLAGHWEGFGIVLLEAMACGVPVVASKLDGSREALREGALGTLVDPGDARDLRAGILQALRRPKGRPPEGLQYFSYGNFQGRVHQLLTSILQSHAQTLAQ